jgi:hypothetical protein
MKRGDARRKEKWADAALEWQISELRKGNIQMPRATRQPDPPPVPPPPDPLPMPEPPAEPKT